MESKRNVFFNGAGESSNGGRRAQRTTEQQPPQQQPEQQVQEVKYERFFRILLRLTDRLALPIAFCNKYNQMQFPCLGHLKTTLGSFTVVVEKDPGSKQLQLTQGWTNFHQRHGIVLGCFAVFTHTGSFNFEVQIFDHSTMEKEKYDTTSSDCYIIPTVKKKIDVIEVDSRESTPDLMDKDLSEDSRESTPNLMDNQLSELTQDWTIEYKTRKSGKSKGRVDVYYVDPTNQHKFRSKKEALRFLSVKNKNKKN